MNEKNIWNRITTNLESTISKSEIKTWFSLTRLKKLDEDMAIIEVPNKFIATWLSENYIEQIKTSFKSTTNYLPEIRFMYSGSKPVQDTGKSKTLKKPTKKIDHQLDPLLTFTSFVNAKSNHFAFSLASDVANTPGVNYNPLYMFSKLSLGKTHLLNAIGNHILSKNPLAKVIYLTLNQLSSDFSNSIRNGKLGKFREFYKNYEILLIDDIHLVAGKERLQKELIYIFDHYYESKKQIAVTGKLPPRHIKNLLPELRSRLEWGLLCELQVPDHSTRMKIIKKKAEEEKISIPDDVIFFLANSTNDLKTVVRYLINLETYASLNKRKLNISIAKSIIKNSPFSKINVNDVQKLTADYFNISVSDLLSNKKTRKFSYPRHVAMYLSRELTGLPFKELAKSFGDKDHSTIIYAVKRIEKDKEKTKVVMNDVNKLQDLLS